MDYLRLYKEDPVNFEFKVYELDKKLKALVISENKVSQEEFDEFYTIKSNLERILTLNIGNINNVLEKIRDSEEGYFDSVLDKDRYKNLHKMYQRIEHYVTDFFDSFDKYEEHHKDNTISYNLNSFKNLISTLNSIPTFSHTLIAPNLSSDPLDKLADPYLKIVQGIIEFLNKNDLINMRGLEMKLDIAEQRCNNFFGFQNEYSSPVAPKIKASAKNNGRNSDNLSIPSFFGLLTMYLRKKLHEVNPSDFGKEKINPMTEEQVNVFLNGGK